MPPGRYQFDTPKSLRDAEDRLITLVEETQSIEAQLADKNKLDARTSERMEEAAYQAWRSKAISALNIKRAEQRYLKRWIKDADVRKRRAALAAIDGNPSFVLLHSLLLIIKAWIKRHGIIPSDEEQKLLDNSRQFLDDLDG